MIRTTLFVCLVACGGGGGNEAVVPDADPADSTVSDGAPMFHVSPGTFDPTFGTNGIVTMDLGGNDFASGVAIQPSGRIVVMTVNATTDALMGFTPDGVIDPTFGTNGTATVADNHGVINGPIVETADAIWIFGGYPSSCLCVERHHLDGSVDASYGAAGIGAVSVQIAHQVSSGVAGGVDASDRVVLEFVDVDGNIEITRLTSSGFSDLTFGTQGFTTLVAGNPRGVRVQSDGAIVAALYPGSSGTMYARLHDDGSMDSSYAPPAATAITVPTAIGLSPSDQVVTIVNSLDNSYPGVYGYRLAKTGALADPFPVLIDTGGAQGAGGVVVARHDEAFALAGGHFGTTGIGFVAQLDATGLAETLWQTPGDFVAAAYDASDRIVAVGETGANGSVATNDVLIARLAP